MSAPRLDLGAALRSGYDAVVVLDTETTGIDAQREEIIELAALRLEPAANGLTAAGEMDDLIRLPRGRHVPPFIVNLTGIDDARLAAEGVEGAAACGRLAELMAGERVLLAAYNAHFDLSFLFYLLRRFDLVSLLKKARFLDILTVYKDRREYPHKLANAITAYGLEDQVRNSHRAVDDAWAAARVLESMAAERDDLAAYVDLFGYNPKYGVEGRRIGSVTYRPQPYRPTVPLYQLGGMRQTCD